MIRCHYDPSNDRWLIDAAAVLTAEQIDACRLHTLRIQMQRHSNMPQSDKRETVGKSIQSLQQGRGMKDNNDYNDDYRWVFPIIGVAALFATLLWAWYEAMR